VNALEESAVIRLLTSTLALALAIVPALAKESYVASLKGAQCTIYESAAVKAAHERGAATVRTLPSGYSVIVADGFNDGKGPDWPETDEQTSHWWVKIINDGNRAALGWVPLAALSCGG
jgi:hypothetical protein